RELDVKYLVVVSIPRSTLPIDYIIEQQSWRSQSKIYLLPGIISGTIGSLGLILLLDRLNRLKQDRLSAESTSASVPATPEPTVSVSGDQEFKNSQQAGTTKPANSTEAYQLLAHMSHELRSPLNGILGFAQIIEQESLMTQANRENIAMIAHSGDRLLLIVNDVVDLAKIEIGQLTLEHNNFDFDSWLHKVEQNFKSQAQNQGWEFSLTKKADLPQYICIDERRLRQVIKNLINYCLKSNLLANIRLIVSSYPKTPATTNTNLDGQDNRHTIEFKFDCTNCSVKTAELATLFDPIIRVKQGQEYAQGSSLSLPISRKLAQLMGGDLTVEASDTSKSSLVFNLTIQAESVAAQKLQIQSTMKRIVGLESNQTEYRILVVDDSKTNRKIMSQLLGSVGFKVKEAVNGSEAIDQWLRWQPHMIWMDLRMPVMNGYEATERIKSSSPNVHIPIVALSASTLEEEKAMFQAAGCDDFVGKPFSDQIIFDKIAQHLGIRYIYESSLPNPLESESSSFKLTADALNVMSNHWLNQVEQAANELNRDLLTQLIEEIPSEYTYLKNALQSQVNNFDFDSILNLIKNSQNN
ncbi:MAG: response regulator, partial [Cyanobacteria bacterium P01_G01_bin.19]